MLQLLKDYTKSQPRLYDLFNSRRPLNSAVEQWLDQFSSTSIRPIKFIQIGANDGLRWDLIRRFVVKDHWQGIFVEPVLPAFRLLKQNYEYLHRSDLVFVNAAISDQDDQTLSIWTYTDSFLNTLPLEKQMYFLRKSSFQKEHVEKFLYDYATTDDKIICIDVKCLRLLSLLKIYWQDSDMDLIVIDTEGYDDKIIQDIDVSIVKPTAILFEIEHLQDRKQALYNHLIEQGYRVTELGTDAVAECTA